MSHVAITNAVFEHDYEFTEIDTNKLKIIHTRNHEGINVPCIEMYATKLSKDLEVIGLVEPEAYFSDNLQFQIGNGSDGGWPQCGPLKKSLGYQAVHQWREIND